jgi:hypothetical protein
VHRVQAVYWAPNDADERDEDRPLYNRVPRGK